ncbi:hypothetical protein Enr13x_38690 [Stieleria neptunia]|uniref:Phytanoyl-CoA dioxygenase (PhyH) n=1 Tax=Stieleria neptunia TaxID=2527979 RepID=A0A518HT43_9BACT|nr:hypothetical protein [Stieleria neptunia]QDV44008.1 hypothetical protein Enr13x_38690 [Stieleria neptunia]
MKTVYFNSSDNERLRRERLYAGELYVYSPTPSGIALCDFARDLCEEAFAPHDPREAQHQLAVETYVEILKTLKPKFIHHPECKKLIPALLEELGCDLEQTYFDVPRLRTACAGDYLNSGLAYAFKPHRDTWYSTPMSQLNWWLPVYPIESNNAMAFHPAYWDTPIQNSSALFNYQDWNDRGRREAAKQIGKDTRVQSEALEPLTRLDPQIRLVPEPGGLIVFSAAHLHSTVPNTTDQTRFSIDFRTVDARDTRAMRGAPNIDGLSTGTTMMDYLRGSDQLHFPDDEIQRFKDAQPVAQYPTPDEVLSRLFSA